MEAWEHLLVQKGLKNMSPELRQQIQAKLVAAWKQELAKQKAMQGLEHFDRPTSLVHSRNTCVAPLIKAEELLGRCAEQDSGAPGNDANAPSSQKTGGQELSNAQRQAMQQAKERITQAEREAFHAALNQRMEKIRKDTQEVKTIRFFNEDAILAFKKKS